MERIARSWRLVKSSWSVLRSDKELALFPIFAAIVSAIGVLILIGLYFLTSGNSLDELADKAEEGSSGGWSIVELVFIFLIYFVTALVATFFNAALIGAALKRLRGGDPTFSDGMAMASSRAGAILGYSAIAATVGVVISMIRSRSNTAGDIAAGILSVAWGVMTFLVVPVLVAENIGPMDAVKRSASLLKKTWGEQIAGNAAIGLIGVLVALPFVIVGVLLIIAAAGSAFLLGLVIALLAVALAVIGVAFSALSAIYKAAVYEYAAEGIVAPQFGNAALQNAFVSKD
jgi:hypothetical protein